MKQEKNGAAAAVPAEKKNKAGYPAMKDSQVKTAAEKSKAGYPAMKDNLVKNSAEKSKAGYPAMKTKIRVTLTTTKRERFYGPGVQDLLAGIREQGSVKDACEAMELSYSKGRRILKHAEAVLGYALVVRRQGGPNGGSASLTPEAEDLLERYDELTAAVSAYAQKKLDEIFGGI